MRTRLGIAVTAVALVSLAACSGRSASRAIFDQQLIRFLEEGATASAMTDLGVTYANLQVQVAIARGAYDLAGATWPEDFPSEPKTAFDHAFTAWTLALDLWNLKSQDRDRPVEPDVNGYDRYVTFAGDLLLTETYPAGFFVAEYSSKKYLPFDENISILLGLASGSFEDGKDQALAAIQEAGN